MINVSSASSIRISGNSGNGNGNGNGEYSLICGGNGNENYCGWLIDYDGVVYQNLLAGYQDTSYASVVCPSDGKFYITQNDVLLKFNADGTPDASWEVGAVNFGTMILDLALDADENIYVVNSRPGVATAGDTIWKLDSDGEVIWSNRSHNYSRATISVVVHTDGFVYVATNKFTGSAYEGLKLNPANGAIVTTYGALKAMYVAVDNFGAVYLAGEHRIYRYPNDGLSYVYEDVDNWGNLTNIFVESGGSFEDTKVFVTGQHEATNKSVWKLNYDLTSVVATYGAHFSYRITKDIDGDLLVAGNPQVAGEDGFFQIVKLRVSDLSFVQGIIFDNEVSLRHVSCQVLE